MIRLALTLALVVALAGCTRARDCAPLTAYQTAAATSLQCAADSGDKYAQLELGIRYETGAGDVVRDLDRAEALYAAAARDADGRRYAYSPPVGQEAYGRVVSVRSGAREAGLLEARQRLARLRAARNGVQ